MHSATIGDAIMINRLIMNIRTIPLFGTITIHARGWRGVVSALIPALPASRLPQDAAGMADA
jgi:hypothetical protein